MSIDVDYKMAKYHVDGDIPDICHFFYTDKIFEE